MAVQRCKSEPRRVFRTTLGYYQQEKVLQKLGSRALALRWAENDEVRDTSDALWATKATHEFMVQMVREILPDGKNVTAEQIEDHLINVELHLANLLVADRQLRLEELEDMAANLSLRLEPVVRAPGNSRKRKAARVSKR
jgi:hypothetical protein